MSRDTTVIPLRQPEAIDDPLSEIAREGARRMLAQVLIAEADSFVAMWKDLKLPDGRDRIVRHGHGPQRAIQTGVGPVEVRRAKVRDRGYVVAEEKIRFTSSILPKWARRTKSLDALLPVLYLRGVSTGDFQEALSALLGKDAPNLSPAVISRLTAEWQTDYDAWQKRDLSARRYVYVWADGVYLQARMEEAAECMLVLIGATPEGKKELVGFQTGVRESAQSWRELLIDIKQRGLEIAGDPELEEIFAQPLSLSRRVLAQDQRQRGPKVYSLHAPEVECIGKGKAHRPYEFGIKVSVATTAHRSKGGQFVTHIAALPGNPYDGHTLATVIPAMEDMIGNTIERLLADAGYRGHNAPTDYKFRIYTSGQKRRLTPQIKRELRSNQPDTQRCPNFLTMFVGGPF